MSNSQNAYRNHKGDLNVQIGEQSSTQKEQSSSQTITLIIGIVDLILTLVIIDDKPSISFKSVLFVVLIFSVACVIFHYCKHNKPTTAKSKAILVGIGLLFGGMFACAIPFFVSNIKSWQISKESIPQEIENSEQQILAQAELYYNGEQYKSVVELYTSDLLLENPIALNNLGYMYSKGIYFDQDFDTAVHYYELASNQGSSDAVHNLIAIQLHSCATFEEVVNVLNTGYNSGDKGTFLFLGSILQGKELSGDPMTVQMRSSIVRDIESFFTADAETQTSILSASFEPPQSGPAFSSVVPQESGSIYEQYILLGSNSVGVTYVYTYLKSPRTFRYDNLMQEHFASVIDSD